MRLEKQVAELEQEIKALKASFEQSATSMNIYRYETNFSTSMNVTNFSNSSPYSVLDWEPLVSMHRTTNGTRFSTESIIVTFNCDAGINTFAFLEIHDVSGWSDQSLSTFTNHRIPYAGGARWYVSMSPNATQLPSGYYSWSPNQLKIVVKSAAPGQLGVKMSWE